LQLWDLCSANAGRPAPLWTSPTHDGVWDALDVDGDLAATSEDRVSSNRLLLHDLRSGRLLRSMSMRPDDGYVHCAHLESQSKVFVSGGTRTLLWDLETASVAQCISDVTTFAIGSARLPPSADGGRTFVLGHKDHVAIVDSRTPPTVQSPQKLSLRDSFSPSISSKQLQLVGHTLMLYCPQGADLSPRFYDVRRLSRPIYDFDDVACTGASARFGTVGRYDRRVSVAARWDGRHRLVELRHDKYLFGRQEKVHVSHFSWKVPPPAAAYGGAGTGRGGGDGTVYEADMASGTNIATTHSPPLSPRLHTGADTPWAYVDFDCDRIVTFLTQSNRVPRLRILDFAAPATFATPRCA
jgi:hypothetical protein